MSNCKSAIPCDQYHGYECNVSGSSCVFIFPDSKLCAELYQAGPDAGEEKENSACGEK